jgi:hypothetical protein
LFFFIGGRSSWFRHLISEYHESNTNDDYVLQVSIDDIHSEVMNEILNFIYTNRCLITLKNAPDLLIAAKRFELEKLTKQIADFLLYRLTTDNAIEMLICAHESGSEALKLACIRLINRHAEKIKRTEKWKAFKTQYIDLIPELYENRVEHPAPQPRAYIPDVFSGPEYPSESLRTLSQLYENPVQRRLQTPTGRIPPPSKFQQPIPPPPPPILKSVQLEQQNEVATPIPIGSYPQRSNSNLSLPMGNNRRPMPPIIRTVLPNIRQNSDTAISRRPVNLYESSYTVPIHNQRTEYARIPTPPPSLRTGSPRRIIETRRTLPLSNEYPDDHITYARVVNIEPSD